LYQLAWTGLDWLYPPQCGGCGEVGLRWCAICQENAEIFSGNLCQRCGDVIADETMAAGSCKRCQDIPPSYKAMRAWAAFEGPLRNALHRLKYQRDLALGEILARNLLTMLSSLEWEIDLVCPVPLSKERMAERGYNQAALLAFPIALGIGKPYRSGALVKYRHTRTQVGLTYPERRENLREAFQARSEFVAGQRVLVVDDVTTSGATFEACAAALCAAGACDVYGLALARPVMSKEITASQP
jgi:competence protein ComFC